MQTLSDLINKVVLKDSLDLHLYSEFVLNESFKTSYFHIIEKYGAYIGQKELIIDLAREIWPCIENKDPEDTFVLNKEDLKEYNNIFFNELRIILDNKRTAFINHKSKFIETDKVFDVVEIEINYNDVTSYNELCSSIMHEILHAFNEYQTYYKTGKRGLLDLTKSGTPYSKTHLTDNIQSIDNICKTILHDIRKFEQNAYLSELAVELENKNFDITKYKTTPEVIKAAKKIFEESSVVKQYTTLKYILVRTNSSTPEVKTSFAKVYNDINNTDFSFDKIYKKLSNAINSIINRIESKISKLIYQYYEEQLNSQLNETYQLSHDRKFINRISEYLELLKEYQLRESVKPDNGLDWEVYVNDKLDTTFTDGAKKWKHQPKVGKGWYCGGTVFEIVKIDGNKVYTIEKK